MGFAVLVECPRLYNMPKRSSTPEDENETAFRVAQEATREVEDDPPAKNPAAVALGRLGGKKGGPARAAKLTPEERSKIARKAAKARWDREGDGQPED